MMRTSMLALTLAGAVLPSSVAAQSTIVGARSPDLDPFNILAPGHSLGTKLQLAENWGEPTSVVPGTDFTLRPLGDSSGFTPFDLADVDIVVLGFTDDGHVPLSPAETGALHTFVLDGGSIVLFAEHSAPGVTAANELASLFGITYATGVGGGYSTQVVPGLTDGPFQPTDSVSFASNAVGGISNIGPDALPVVNKGSGFMGALIRPGILAPMAGGAFFWADSGHDSMTNGFGSPSAQSLILNAFELLARAGEPETGVIFLQPSSLVDESAASLSVDVVLTQPSGTPLPGPVSVTVIDSGTGTATGGSDYMPIGSPSVTFPAGSLHGATGSVIIDLVDDSLDEQGETIELILTGLVGDAEIGSPATHTVTIMDDELTVVGARSPDLDPFNILNPSHALGAALQLTENWGGPTSVVPGTEFVLQPMGDASGITPPDLAGVDIAVIGFTDDSNVSLASGEADALYDHVLAGGSLVVFTEFVATGVDNANVLTDLFGVTFATGVSGGFSTQAVPGFTDGPFQPTDSVSFASNAVGGMSDIGIDAQPVVSKGAGYLSAAINPGTLGPTAGGVFFWADSGHDSMSNGFGSPSAQSLILNAFARLAAASGRAVECQTDLGFAGPGNTSLSVCGDDLTMAGSSATLQLSSSASAAPVFLFAGVLQAPTPLAGGTLVPVPWLPGFPIALVTDPSGDLGFPIPGGAGGPITIYVQAVVSNAGLLEFSNAVAVSLGI